jgi:sialidase-1
MVMKMAILPLMMTTIGLSSAAAEPFFETTCVFSITPANITNYRIPSILQAPNGDLLIFAEKRNDGIGDLGNHDIVLKRSRDLGKTWEAEQIIFDDETAVSTDITVGRIGERIWLFYDRIAPLLNQSHN